MSGPEEGETCNAYVPQHLQDADRMSHVIGPPLESSEEGEMSRDSLVDELAYYMMVNRCGFSPNRDDFPLEWDKTYEDSQLALLISDIEMVFDYLEEVHGYDFSAKPLNDN